MASQKQSVAPRLEVTTLERAHVPVEGRAGALRLDFNENTVGCSPSVHRAIARLTPADIATYPEYEEARRRLSRSFRVSPSELILTNGADDALRLIVDCFAERGSEFLLVDPTFPMYRFYAQLAGGRIHTLRYDDHMRFPFRQALPLLRRQARGSRPRIFFLANPNNPTGTLVPRAQLKQLLEAVRNTLFVLDEAYFEFSGVTALPWIRRYPHLLVVRTFSKAVGLAGLRLGCILTNRRTAEFLRAAQPPFPVNTVALAAALAALRDRRYFRWYVREVQKSRTMLQKFLTAAGLRVFPSTGNFLLADFGSAATRIIRTLSAQRILLRDRQSDFGRIGPVRITLGTQPQTRRLIRALKPLL